MTQHDTTDRLTDLKSLPRQWSSVEVHQHVAEWLEVVTAALLTAQVCVNTGISCCTCQILIITVRYVRMSVSIYVLLGQTKVNQEHLYTHLYAQRICQSQSGTPVHTPVCSTYLSKSIRITCTHTCTLNVSVKVNQDHLYTHLYAQRICQSQSGSPVHTPVCSMYLSKSIRITCPHTCMLNISVNYV